MQLALRSGNRFSQVGLINTDSIEALPLPGCLFSLYEIKVVFALVNFISKNLKLGDFAGDYFFPANFKAFKFIRIWKVFQPEPLGWNLIFE